jgi:hypothetical protein
VNLDLIYYKYFIFPYGLNDAEVFLYTDIIWNIHNKRCPYKLDGIIFTPLD